jgi:hypothetical protein
MRSRGRRSRGRLGRQLAALAAAACVWCGAVPDTQAQSAADRGGGLTIDGRTDDWRAVEAAFRNADVCAQLPPPPCGADEERPDDSVASALQDVRQLRVTWDARALYVAAEGTLGGQALLVFLDWTPGGLTQASGALGTWRRALRFGPEMQPDAFLAVGDGQSVPELWRASGEASAVRVAAEDFAAAASFSAEATGRALEAAIPWSVLFPDAAVEVDPENGAPATPMFVLPPESSTHGLRLAAAVVGAVEGLGSFDVAPDNTGGVPLDPRMVTVVDRAVLVDWDAVRQGAPHFVDFGAAVQTQTSPRFLPASPVSALRLRIENLRTFADGMPSRLLVPDAGLVIAFAFDVAPRLPAAIYVTATLHSMRGDRVRELYRDSHRVAGAPSPTTGAFGDPQLDRWDGRDGAGRAVPAGVYVLRLSAGLTPGVVESEERRALTVVR